MRDLWTMMWKEWRDVIFQGGRSSLLRPAILIVIVGIVIPLQAKDSWGHLPVVAVLAEIWAPLFVIISIIGDAFAGERERHTLETLLATRMPDQAILGGKMAVAVIYGFAFLVIDLFLGIIVVNLGNWQGHVVFYPAGITIATLALGLTVTLFGAAAGVLVSLRSATVRQAQQTLAVGTTVLLFGGIAAVQALPSSFLSSLTEVQGVLLALGIVAALDVVLLSAVAAQYRRSRLILS